MRESAVVTRASASCRVRLGLSGPPRYWSSAGNKNIDPTRLRSFPWMKRGDKRAGLHDRERFLSGAVTNSTNPARSTPTTTTPRLYAITRHVVIAPRLESQLPSPFTISATLPSPTSFPREGKKERNFEEGIEKSAAINRNIPFLFHRSSFSLVLSKILVTVRFELGKNRERHIKIGKFDRFFEETKFFLKTGRKGVTEAQSSSSRGFKRSTRLSDWRGEERWRDKMMMEISLNRVRRGKWTKNERWVTRQSKQSRSSRFVLRFIRCD